MRPSQPEISPRKYMLVTSRGGHLDHLLALEDLWKGGPRCWITYASSDSKERDLAGETVFFCPYPVEHDSIRGWVNLVRSMALAIQLIRREKPSIIFSTGAGCAVPFFLIGRILGVTTCFMEVYDRVASRTATGRAASLLCDYTFVQWPHQKVLYPKAHLVGKLY